MKISETRMETGGLMRCCLATIDDYATNHADDEAIDMELDCMHEAAGNKQILLEGGRWRWQGMNRPDGQS